MSGTAEWLGIVEAAELLNVRIGEWHDFGYLNPPAPGCKSIPPLGERSAEAIKGGHCAVEVIDEIIAELHSVRDQLVTEMRTDEDIRAARVDAMLAGDRTGRAAQARPEWLYGSGCCERWTPEDGCPQHTGRPAMSLKARELDRPGEAGGAR